MAVAGLIFLPRGILSFSRFRFAFFRRISLLGRPVREVREIGMDAQSCKRTCGRPRPGFPGFGEYCSSLGLSAHDRKTRAGARVGPVITAFVIFSEKKFCPLSISASMTVVQVSPAEMGILKANLRRRQ
jgi:hypothetical protein